MSAVQEGHSLRSSMGRCEFSGLWQTNMNECMISCSVVSDSFRHYKLWPSRLLYPQDFPGKNTGVGYHFLLKGIFLSQGSNPCLLCLLHWQTGSLPLHHLLLLSRFSRVRPCVTPETAAYQAPPSLGFCRQEHWSGLPFPSPRHESEK